MRVTGTIVGVFLVIIGGVWVLQGINSEFAPQSFMTGSGTWVVIGLATALGGVGVVVWSRRRPS